MANENNSMGNCNQIQPYVHYIKKTKKSLWRAKVVLDLSRELNKNVDCVWLWWKKQKSMSRIITESIENKTTSIALLLVWCDLLCGPILNNMCVLFTINPKILQS